MELCPTMNGKLLAAVVACGLPLVTAGTAAADSIVFIKDKNVWVANPDGSAARAITTDGAQSEYWSPSQADDGTIAVAHRQGIELWNRDGTKIAELDPPARTDSVSHPVDGAVADVAISPDGKTIAFAYANYSCPVAADCTARETMGYMPTSGSKPASEYSGNIYLGDPSFYSNTETVAFGGYNHQVNYHVIGPGTTDFHWFDDWNIVGHEASTDLNDGEMNRQHTKFAAMRGYGNTTHLVWYKMNGEPSVDPTMVCGTGKLAGIHGPSWAPNGDALAWGEPDGIWTIPSTRLIEPDCAKTQPTLTIPGGSEPDWGPADIGAPKPPEKTVKPTDKDPEKTPGTNGGDGGVQMLVTVELAKKLKLRGFTAAVTVPTAGKLVASAKVGKKVAYTGSATAKAGGEVKVKLKATKFGKKLARKRKATAKLTLTFTPAGGKPQAIYRTLKLTR
jgi:hypothetical protein